MKWNWGTGIFIVIVLFLGACVAFIIYAQHQKFNLTEEDYYPKELRHEEKLNKMRNANALAAQLQVMPGKSNLALQFPSDFRGKTLKGSIHIYRPSDENLDVILPVAVDTSLIQLIPMTRLSKGRYVVKVDWTSGGKDYYVERDIFIP
ncbi:MAG: FixH family protein [Bacteroidetes bacterium]|nr:FixH family protein [Bacteroidota bacterium]